MNNSIKNKTIISLLLVFISVCFIGCIKTKGYKTVVIQQEHKDKYKSSKENKTSFEISKIYKHDLYRLEKKNINYEYLLGWKDKENILAISLLNDNTQYTLYEMNYKYGFKKDILNLNSKVKSVKLSPKGDKIIYVKEDEKKQICVKNINTGKEKFLVNIKINSINYYEKWCGNGRYVIFSDDLYIKQNKIILYIYDVYKDKLKKITLYKAYDYIVNSIDISNDSNSIIIVGSRESGKEGTNTLNLIYLDNNEVKINKENEILNTNISIKNPKFFENDKVLFIKDIDDSLYIYDIKTKDIVKLDNNINKFNVSQNSKYIMYEKYTKQYSSDVFVMELDNTKVKRKKLIYKGFKVTRMWWSEDNKKILLVGNKQEHDLIWENTMDDENIQKLILEFK